MALFSSILAEENSERLRNNSVDQISNHLEKFKSIWNSFDIKQPYLKSSTSRQLNFDCPVTGVVGRVFRYKLIPVKKEKYRAIVPDLEAGLEMLGSALEEKILSKQNKKTLKGGIIEYGGKSLVKEGYFKTEQEVDLSDRLVKKVTGQLTDNFPGHNKFITMEIAKYFARNNGKTTASKFKEFIYSELFSNANIKFSLDDLEKHKSMYVFDIYRTVDNKYIKTPIVELKNVDGELKYEIVRGKKMFTHELTAPKTLAQFALFYKNFKDNKIITRAFNCKDASVKLDLDLTQLDSVVKTFTLIQTDSHRENYGYLIRDFNEVRYGKAYYNVLTGISDIQDEKKYGFTSKRVQNAIEMLGVDVEDDDGETVFNNLRSFIPHGKKIPGEDLKTFVNEELLNKICTWHKIGDNHRHSNQVKKLWEFSIIQTSDDRYVKTDMFCLEKTPDNKMKISTVAVQKINTNNVNYKIVEDKKVDVVKIRRYYRPAPPKPVVDHEEENWMSEEECEEEFISPVPETNEEETSDYSQFLSYGVITFMSLLSFVILVFIYKRRNNKQTIVDYESLTSA